MQDLLDAFSGVTVNALVVGNPAKQIGWACECGERLADDLECLTCGKQYEKRSDGLIAIRS